MTTFITGSRGFLGSNLAPRLGDYVPVPHDEIMETDFSSATRVFFCSAYGNMSTHTDEQTIIEANLLHLLNVLYQMNWPKIESFVHISTSSVKLQYQTMYSRTKKAAEEVLLGYLEKYNAPITIVRPFSITGVGEQEAHLIPTLIRNITAGVKVKLDPDPVHDFIDVEDVVEGIINLSNNKARGVYDLGTGTATTNEQVLHLVEKTLNKKATVDIVRGLRLYDNDIWVSRNFKSRSWGWAPMKSLEQSIEESVNAFK